VALISVSIELPARCQLLQIIEPSHLMQIPRSTERTYF